MARLCWIATLIGVFSLIVVSSIMNGFNRSIRTKLLAVEPHLVVTASDENLAPVRPFIDSLSGAEKLPFAKQDVIVRTLDGHFSGAVAKGLPTAGIAGFLRRVADLRMKEGAKSHVDLNDAELDTHEILMGVDLARDLSLFEGDEVMLIPPETLLLPQGESPKYEKMRIKALFSSEFQDADSKLILFKMNERPLRFQVASSQETGIELRFKRPDDAEGLKEEILRKFGGSATGDGAHADPKLKVETWADRNSALFFALKLEKMAMSSFLGLAVLITCFSLVTVLVMLISQKRKEIGLLMALGLSRAKTQKLFLWIGICLSGFGLFAGLILGVIVSLLIEAYPVDILPDIYFDSSLPAQVNFTMVGFVALGSLCVAFLAAYVPVRMYLKNSPADNLRLVVSE